MPQFREEVVNVQLAEALVARGLHANPETVTRKKELPDVIIDLGGLKLVIEGRIETSLRSLLSNAGARITDGLADISIAVAYPKALMSAPTLAVLREQIESGTYSGAVFSFTTAALKENKFSGISIGELADLVNTCFRLVVQNDVVREQVQQVESMIEGIVETAVKSDLFFASDVLNQRLRKALGIASDAKADPEEID